MSDPQTPLEKSAAAPETEAIKARYARRKELRIAGLYEPLRASVYMSQQERERKLIEYILRPHLAPVANKRLLEIGCGSGENLLALLRLGFRPENLVANELLPERAAKARARLPLETKVLEGDASVLELPSGSFDAVLQSTVFTSILDDAFQHKLADAMWRLLRPGGGLIWYDFAYNNPNNPDVRAVPLQRVRQLFPGSEVRCWRVTLAPPLARRATAIHPRLYSLLNGVPLLRSHLLCWIPKS